MAESGSTFAAPRSSEPRAEVDGGESGIRTHGRVSPTHAFQACSFNHSDISPFRINHLRAVWNSVTQNPPLNASVRGCGLDSAGYRDGSSSHQSKLCNTSYLEKSLTVISIVRRVTSPPVLLFITFQALSESWEVTIFQAGRRSSGTSRAACRRRPHAKSGGEPPSYLCRLRMRATISPDPPAKAIPRWSSFRGRARAGIGRFLLNRPDLPANGRLSVESTVGQLDQRVHGGFAVVKRVNQVLGKPVFPGTIPPDRFGRAGLPPPAVM